MNRLDVHDLERVQAKKSIEKPAKVVVQHEYPPSEEQRAPTFRPDSRAHQRGSRTFPEKKTTLEMGSGLNLEL
ncbi:hypothetical protein [Sulfitobacter sp. CS16]|uniref:hypothetical protein n=1 Tax=Sulfitobacter sp. CS16 TaxID=3368573 RepID=UPI003745F5B4